MSRSFLFYTVLLAVPLVCDFSNSYAQEKSPWRFDFRVAEEYRSNIRRAADSLKTSDFRTNLLGFGEYLSTLFSDASLRTSYELRYHRHLSENEFDRHAHLLRIFLDKPIFGNAKASVSNEFRLRFHPDISSFDNRRNVLDGRLRYTFRAGGQFALGYQNWTKTYPNSTDYQDYTSNRFYLKYSKMVWSANASLKVSIQEHRGNLFPGSTAPNQDLNLESARLVVHFTWDKIINKMLLIGLAYRHELDEPDDSDFEQLGRNLSDEDVEELLADDADFGYEKRQYALSTLIRLNDRTSLVTFYVLQSKSFDHWRIYERGPLRDDDLWYLSNVLKINVLKDFGVRLHYSLERNESNLLSHMYTSNAVSVGVFWVR